MAIALQAKSQSWGGRAHRHHHTIDSLDDGKAKTKPKTNFLTFSLSSIVVPRLRTV